MVSDYKIKMIFIGPSATLRSVPSVFNPVRWIDDFTVGKTYEVLRNGLIKEGWGYFVDDLGYKFYLPLDCFELEEEYNKLKL